MYSVCMCVGGNHEMMSLSSPIVDVLGFSAEIEPIECMHVYCLYI
jgi:hypothetical protein